MTRRRFADLADAGRQLGAALAEPYGAREGVVVLGVEPHGLVVAHEVASVLGGSARGLPPQGPAPAGLSGAVVLLVDDGVEGGGTAAGLGALLRAAGPARLVLAVPVCPREPYAALARIFDEVVALERPFMARSLAWHFDSFPGGGDARVP